MICYVKFFSLTVLSLGGEKKCSNFIRTKELVFNTILYIFFSKKYCNFVVPYKYNLLKSILLLNRGNVFVLSIYGFQILNL